MALTSSRRMTSRLYGGTARRPTIATLIGIGLAFETLALGSGRWLEAGTASGRMVLFLVALALVFYTSPMKLSARPSTSVLAVWMAVVVPLSGITVAILGGVDLQSAASEADAYVFMLAYFVYSRVSRTHGSDTWITIVAAATVVVGTVTAAMYLAYYGGENVGLLETLEALYPGSRSYWPGGQPRIILSAHIVLMFGLIVVFGSWRFRPIDIAALSLSLPVLAVGGSRALLLGTTIGVATVSWVRLRAHFSAESVRRSALMLGILVSLGLLTVGFLPRPALERFLSTASLADRSNAVRAESVSIMLRDLSTPVEWLVGKGFGSTLEDYARDGDAPWQYEVTYVDALHDAGLVVFGAWVVLVCMLTRRLRVLHRKGSPGTKDSGFASGVIVGGLVVILVGWTNPITANSTGFSILAMALAVSDRYIVGPSRKR